MKQLVLVGTGRSHVHVLQSVARLARSAQLPFKLSLVAAHPRHALSDRLPDWVCGRVQEAACSADLSAWLQTGRVQFISGRAIHLDTATQRLRVQQTQGCVDLHYDLLSLDTEPELDRHRVETSLPGAREHALFLRPQHAFLPLWTKLLDLARERALRIAIVGGSAVTCELALAVKSRLPHCAVTLVSGKPGPVGHWPEAGRRRVAAALRDSGVQVLPMTCTAAAADHIELDHRTRLACDAPLLALDAQAPHWLADSGLALDAQGFLVVNPCMQSVSHPQVLAACGLTDQDRAWDAEMCHDGQALAHNVLAAVQMFALRPCPAKAPGMRLLSSGKRDAIASWGDWSAQGRWVWLLKYLLQRRRAAWLRV